MNKILMLLLVLFLCIPLAEAKLEEVELEIHGMACTFCAFGLEKKIRKFEGVKDFKVDIKKGKARFRLEEGAEVSVTKLREAVKEAGLTFKEVSTSLVGSVTQSEIGYVFQSEASGQKFLIYENKKGHDRYHSGKKLKALSKRLARKLEKAQSVRLTGYVHEHHDLPPGLVIKEYEILV